MKQTRNLQALIYRSYLTSALVPILMIELVLLVLYFGINAYISEQNKQTMLAEVSLHLRDVSLREASNINNQLKEVSRYAEMLQREHQHFFASPGTCYFPNGRPEFGIHANGVLYKLIDNGGSSLYYPGGASLDQASLAKARCSEQLDGFLKAVVETSPIITQAYLNTRDNMVRIYPFIPDLPEQFGPALQVDRYNFYYLADASHNPDRKPVWTGVYLDPAGQGWMISNIVPVYRGDFLEGVSGLDVTIDVFIRQILDLEISWDAKAFMVDGNGTILAVPEDLRKLFRLPALDKAAADTRNDEYLNTSLAYSLTAEQNDAVLNQLQKMFQAGTPIAEIVIDNKRYLLSQEAIAESGWRLFILADESLIFKKIFELDQLSERIGFIAIGAMLFFYAAFFFYLRRKSVRIASRIAGPIEKLSLATEGLGAQLASRPLDPVGIKEIDRLSSHFNDMVHELGDRTQKLIEMELQDKIKQREAELLETLALTDRLTGLANRHKLDEALDTEFARSQRFENRFGVILFDIDHFKRINDTFGHQAGDLFLKEIAGILRDQTRSTDTIGRWGGEEFMIICPKSHLQGLMEVAEHLRSAIEKHDFSQVGKRTASFGLTLSEPEDTRDSLIRRADQALYRAKHRGRNRIETA